MKILIIHQENRYFGGAEVLLGQFLAGLKASGCEVHVAAVSGSRFAGLVPADVPLVPLADNTRFSPMSFWRQLCSVMAAQRTQGFDVLHGWAARDWELTALAGRLTGRPSLGLLHDHPEAPFFPKKRRLLMRMAGKWLTRIACVSFAVQEACVQSRYDRNKLVTVHNGIKIEKRRPGKTKSMPVRLGFLGVFSERKGLRNLFDMVSLLAQQGPLPWELHLAGDAQDDSGRALIDEIRKKHGDSSWWNRIFWLGWVAKPLDFLEKIDLLICPSSEFEPCPLVVCEAGAMGVPVLAARTGGIPEIISDKTTGWLYPPGDVGFGAEVLRQAIREPDQLKSLGEAAARRIGMEFNLTKMVAEYRNIYSNLARNVWK